MLSTGHLSPAFCFINVQGWQQHALVITSPSYAMAHMNTFPPGYIFNCFVFSFAFFSVVTQHTLGQLSKSLHTSWCVRLSTNVILEGFCPGLTQPGRTHCQEDRRPSRANVGPTGNLGLTHSKGCFPRGGSRFSATNKWIFLLSQKPHAATHSGHSPHQSQGQRHKRKSYEENGLRLCKKPRHIDMGRVLGRCKTYIHHTYLSCGDTKPIWAREAIMVMKTLSVISYRASHSTWMLCSSTRKNTHTLPANTC